MRLLALVALALVLAPVVLHAAPARAEASRCAPTRATRADGAIVLTIPTCFAPPEAAIVTTGGSCYQRDSYQFALRNQLPGGLTPYEKWSSTPPAPFALETGNSTIAGATLRSELLSAWRTWDNATSATLVSNITIDAQGRFAGHDDGVDEITWRHAVDDSLLDGGLVGYTMIVINGFQILESDQVYNADLPWAVGSNDPSKLDVREVATHLFGLTFGLDWVFYGVNADCLTMYPYFGTGEFFKRTLATGDGLGIEVLYGR